MNIDEKARSISILIIQLSVNARRSGFRQRLEYLSFECIEAISMRDIARATDVLAAIKGLISFGRMIYEIEPVSAHFAISEIKGFEDFIKEFSTIFLPENSGVSLFSSQLSKSENMSDVAIMGNVSILEPAKSQKPRINKLERYQEVVSEDVKSTDIKAENGKKIDNAAKGVRLIEPEGSSEPKRPEDSAPSTMKSSGLNSSSSLKALQSLNGPRDDNAAMRQSAIVDVIRQSNDNQVQLRDVVAAFPGVSERTVRYDIARLCSQGIIERFGFGGRGTYYKIRVI